MGGIPEQVWDLIDKCHVERRPLELANVMRYALLLTRVEDQASVPASWLELDLGASREQFFHCPPQVVDFVLDYIGDDRFGFAVDPVAGCGYLLGTLVRRGLVSRAAGYCQSFVEWAAASNLFPQEAVHWTSGGLEAAMEGHDDAACDLVVSSLPSADESDLACRELDLGGGRRVVFPCSCSQLILLRAAMRLAQGGLGVFLTDRTLVQDHGPTSVRAALESGGLFPVVAVEVSSGGGGDLLLIVRRLPHPPEQVFVGVLPAERNEIRLLAENARSGCDGIRPELGRLTGWDTFYSFDTVRAGEEFKRRSLLQGLPVLPLGEMLATSQQQADSTNCINITSEGVARPLGQEGQPGAFSFHLDPGRISVAYAVEYLRSEIGRLALRAVSTRSYGIGVTEDRLRHLPVIVPERGVQDRVVSVQGLISDLKLGMEREERRLWQAIATPEVPGRAVEHLTRRQTISEWLELLPFPIAACLYDAEATTDPRTATEALHGFFESFALFESIIMWSLLRDTARSSDGAVESDGANDRPGKFVFKLHAPTLGHWVAVRGMLASAVVRSRCPSLGDANGDAALLRAWSANSAEVTHVLQDASALRNQWKGHGGHSTPEEVLALARNLRTLVSRLHKAIGIGYEDVQLICPGMGVLSGLVWRGRARLLRGSRRSFKEVEVEATRPLDSMRTYLILPGGPQPVEVCPLLKIVEPDGPRPSCYFVKGVSGASRVSWYCHHANECSQQETDSTESAVEMRRLAGWVAAR